MIELRFETRVVHDQRTGTANILQQRTKTKFVDSGNVGGSYFDWTEWEDVPVVDGTAKVKNPL